MSTMTGGANSGAEPELVPAGPPRVLRANLWATGVWCLLNVLSNLVLFGQRPYLRKSLIDQNAKAKKPIADYAATRADHDVHSQLVGGLIEVLLVSVILLLLAGLAGRGRPWARWALLALATVGVPLRVGVLAQLVLGAAPSSAPGLYRFSLVIAGFAAMVVVVFLLHRTTREYFAALKQTQRGDLPAVPGSRVSAAKAGPGAGGSGRTGARPAGGGLGALFAPRRRAGAAPDPVADSGRATADGAGDDTADAVTATTAPPSRRPTATRPGSVKAKGSGTRSGRFKSRQQ